MERRAQIPGLIALLGVLAGADGALAGPGGGVVVELGRTIASKAASLDSIRAELTRGRDKLAQLRKQEGSFLEQLEQIERNMAVSKRYLARVTRDIDTVTMRIDGLRDSLEQAHEQLADRQTVMAERLRSMYKVGPGYRTDALGMFRIAVTSPSIGDMIHRVRYAQALNRYDRQILASIQRTRTRIENHGAALEARRAELVDLRSRKEEERERLADEQSGRRDMLKKVRAEKSAYEEMVKELEQAQAELNLIIAQLEKKRREAKADIERGRKVAFDKRKGKLPWPVAGQVARRFGKIVHPVYKTVTMSHGVDIQAARGHGVSCVAPGRVDYVGWMRGYGRFVIVNHYGGYLTIYAHLDQVLVTQDQEIELGTAVGVVGETGSLSGPKLHFQIRAEAEPVDPLDWLEQRE